ncbi:MAG: M16 family metallopeptidase [Candidatus Puniceispirillaceae bacterium]
MTNGMLTELGSGLKVATRAMPQARSLSVGIWVNAGARDERDSETGIAHMLEHMAFKGTKHRSARDIATEVENVGGYMNAHTSREETAYYLRLLPEYLDMGIDILADILTEPTMPDEEIERERGVIIQEIGQSLDTPDDIVFDMFAKASYGTHTLGRPILGSVDSVSGFSRDNLRGFMARHYGAGQMLVTGSGAVDHDDFVGRVESRLSRLQTAEHAERTAPQWLGGRHVETRDLEQTHLVIGLPSFGATDERRYALMLLSTLFGGGMSSRLFQEVREKRGLCYSIFSFASMYSDSGHFGIYAGTSAAQADEMLSVTASQLADLAAGVGPEELDRAKAQLRASLVMSRESVAGCGDSLARQIMLFGAPQDDGELLERIADVSAKDVAGVAADLITGGQPVIAAIGPESTIMSNETLAGILAGKA